MGPSVGAETGSARARRARVLVRCTGNSCRLQMAEGWIRAVAGDRFEVASAGTRPAAAVSPLAVRAMAEVGIDISSATPKCVDRFTGDRWDLVVTVCDSAAETCPFFPEKVERLHVSFPDPAGASGTKGERIVAFRAVRDDIRFRLVPTLLRWATARGERRE